MQNHIPPAPDKYLGAFHERHPLGLNLTGVLDSSATFAGYVNNNVILCIGMFVVGQALFETGMANRIGGVVTRFAKSERMLIIAIMVIVGVMSGFLSNTGTAAVLIPVVCGIADESGYSRSRLFQFRLTDAAKNNL